jgi:hypothetical protein
MEAEFIFNFLKAPNCKEMNVTVSASFFEIYSSEVFDLMNNKARLHALEDGRHQMQIVGLQLLAIESPFRQTFLLPYLMLWTQYSTPITSRPPNWAENLNQSFLSIGLLVGSLWQLAIVSGPSLVKIPTAIIFVIS